MNETAIGQKQNAWLPVVVLATLIAITAGCGTTSDSTTIAGVGTGGTGTVTGSAAAAASGFAAANRPLSVGGAAQ